MCDAVFRVRVTGLVQGVWFRAWTQSEAVRLELSGWVRNEADGSVCALVAGPEEKVGEMLRLLWSGPASARVDSVVTEQAEAPSRCGFQILR